MKRVAMVAALALVGAAQSLYAGPCSALTTLQSAIAAGSCDFAGVTFSSFNLNFPGSNTTNYLGSDVTTDNVNITFAGGPSSFTVGFSSNAGPGWTVTTNGGNPAVLEFSISYSITDNFFNGTNRINTGAATVTGASFQNDPAGTFGQDPNYRLTKTIVENPGAVNLGTATVQGAVSPAPINVNPTGGTDARAFSTNSATIDITDTLKLTTWSSSPVGGGISSLTVGSISNTFNATATPEPMTVALMGVGLAGLALFRRRRQ